MTDYLDELAGHLRDGGLDPARVGSVVADVRSYLRESGADPVTEFGQAAEFAAEFTGAAGAGTAAEDPEPESEQWSWTADTFADEELLNRHGEQGWEVIRVDRLGRFVCRRDRTDPQAWEYRREWVLGDRPKVEARLAPEGWEPCGSWVVYEWYKRPLAASVGPAAAVAEPPPVPRRSSFFTRRFYAILVAVPLVLVVMAIVEYALSGDVATGLGTIAGGAVGAAAGALGVFAYAAWQNRSR